MVNIQERVFDSTVIATWVLYIISLLGLSLSAPKYLQWLDYLLKVYVCLFLIIRFNPIRKKVDFTDLDRKIVFISAMFLLTTTILTYLLPLITAKIGIKL